MTGLRSLLAREQWAFLRRDRLRWEDHLARARAFLGEGLRAGGAALVLGAGSGLEVPWALAAQGTTGWDADPSSRIRTFLRHGRWAPWVFEDLTGGMETLARTAERCARQPGSGRIRATRTAGRRLAGLMNALQPEAAPLAAWIEAHRPAAILSANVMGQFGVLAQRTVERAFGGILPWMGDGEEEDVLDEAIRAWTARAVRAHLARLGEAGVPLWLLHDRGVVFGNPPLELGPLAASWLDQLVSPVPLEVDDPLCGVDVAGAFPGRALAGPVRWLWPVGPGQVHVIEALRVGPG